MPEGGNQGALSPVDQAKGLATKAAGGWVEGMGDRAIQSGIAALLGSAAVTTLLAVLKTNWPIVVAGGVASLIFFGVMAKFIKVVRGSRAASRDSAEATKALQDQVRALLEAPGVRVALAPPSEHITADINAHQIQILDGLQEERSYFRVVVRNLTNTTARIGAYLTKLDPMPDGLSLPLPLQITHGDSTPVVAVPAHAAQAIDVFRMFGIKEGVIELQGTNTKAHLPKTGYRFMVTAYVEHGGSVERSFQMRPGLIQASFDAPIESLSPDGNRYLVDNEVSGGQVEKAHSVAATVANTLATRHGNVDVAAFGILDSITFECLNQATSAPRFRCSVDIVFYGLIPVKPSPTQLRVAIDNGGAELARLDANARQTCPGIVRYTGEGDWRALMDAVEKTMVPTWPPEQKSPYPWKVFPPGGSLQCQLELSIPDGKTRSDHFDSGVKLEFELDGYDNKIIVATIRPWPSDQTHSISLTRL